MIGSEALCAVADAALQIHGGLGYLRGTWVEQSFSSRRARQLASTKALTRSTGARSRRGLLRAIRRGKLDVAAPAAEAARVLVQGGAPPLDAGSPRALAAHVRRLALVGLAGVQ